MQDDPPAGRAAWDDPDDGAAPHSPENRRSAESKLRRGTRHCPLCLAPLGRNAPRTRRVRHCATCRAHPSRDKCCQRCGAAAVWENKSGAACQRCGHHGPKRAVIAAA